MDVYHLLFSLQGRIGRAAFAVALTGMSLVIGLAIFIFGSPPTWRDASIVQAVALTGIAYPHWALAVKRAHDLDRSGWWLAGWIMVMAGALLMIVGAFVSLFGRDPTSAVLFMIAATVLGLAATWQLSLKMFFFSGTAGVNDYGQPCRLLQDYLNDNSLPPPVEAPRDLVHATDSRRPVIAGNAGIGTTTVSRSPSVRPIQGGFARRNPARPA